MTLLLALANDSYSIVLGDRRLTCNGCVMEEERNKVCILFCDDARVAIAYTGVAQHFSFTTREWLRETLSNIGKTKHCLDGMLAELQLRASRVFRQFPNSTRHTAFLIAGWQHGSGEPKRVCQLLSNFDHNVKYPRAGPLFDFYDLGSVGGVLVEASGCKNVLCEKDYADLRMMLQANNPPQKVLCKAVEILQRVARDKTYKIGKQCNSAVIPRITDTTITATYHSARPKDTVYASDVVIAVSGCGMVCDYMAMGCEGAILAGPLIRGNADCWCGSGKKFRDCHKRSFGSVYAQIPGFRKPMYMTFAVQAKKPVAIGRNFYVQTGFA